MNLILSFGRNASNNVVIKNPSVSSTHAIIIQISETELQVRDLGSTNGTTINGELIRNDHRIVTLRDEVLLGTEKLDLRKYFSDDHTIIVKNPIKAFTVTIGRSHDCDYRIEHKSVSGFHAKITRLTGRADHANFEVEDTNSGNGTFIDGIKIQKTRIKGSEEIRLGEYKLDIQKIFPDFVNPVLQQQKEEERIYSEFEQLRTIWEAYKQARNKDVNKGKLIQVIGGMVAPFGLGGIGNALSRNKNFELIENLKINYLCPKCKIFLGETPWEGLHRCHSCRTVLRRPTQTG